MYKNLPLGNHWFGVSRKLEAQFGMLDIMHSCTSLAMYGENDSILDPCSCASTTLHTAEYPSREQSRIGLTQLGQPGERSRLRVVKGVVDIFQFQHPALVFLQNKDQKRMITGPCSRVLIGFPTSRRCTPFDYSAEAVGAGQNRKDLSRIVRFRRGSQYLPGRTRLIFNSTTILPTC